MTLWLLILLPTAHLKEENKYLSPKADVLILYDSYGQWGWIGQLYSLFLHNLMGHFNLRVEIEPVKDYQKGELETFSTIFYLGNVYNNFLPVAFLDDVYNTERTVVWFKYNIWQLSRNRSYDFQSRFGFDFQSVVGLNDDPSPENSNPGFYDTIHYQGRRFYKYYHYDPEHDVWEADPFFGLTYITDSSIATPYAMAENSVHGTQAPYVLKGANLWYIADIPFSYLHEEDRYIPFCDLLHDILGIYHPPNHRALIRLEYIDPQVNPDWIYTITDTLYDRHVPFAICLIPAFIDPLAFYYDEPVEYHLEDFPDMVAALHYAEDHGGSIILHGFTHQYDSRPNPYTGVTGDDFEFWDALNNQPLKEDSEQWVRSRINSAIGELKRYDIYTDAFATPHYLASELDYTLFGQLFVNTVQRTGYFAHSTSYSMRADPRFFLSLYPQYFGGQFFPYVIIKDFYGQRITPENLGGVAPEVFVLEGGMPRSSADILRAAEKGLVVRDGWASFFFHPFLLNYPEFYPYGGIQTLIDLVEGLKELGYQFVDLREELPPISIPAEKLLFGSGENGSSQVRICDILGRVSFSKVVWNGENPSGEIHVAAGDVNGDGIDEIIVGEGEGGSSRVKVLSRDGAELFEQRVFGTQNRRGEVNVAAGDVVGDGMEELILGHGEGGNSRLVVMKLDGTVLFNKRVFGSLKNPSGEVKVASGDLDGDGTDEIICGQGYGGDNWVKVFELNGSVIFNQRVFGSLNSNGEVHVGAGDVDGDGVDEIICGQGYRGDSRVKVFELNGRVIFNRKVFGPPNINGEVHVEAGDIDGDGIDEIICGQGRDGQSVVKVFELNKLLLFQRRMFSSEENPSGSVYVAAGRFSY